MCFVSRKTREKESAQYWLFVDSQTRVVSRRLSQQAAENFIINLKNVNFDHWWAWNPCFSDWIPLRNIVDSKSGKMRLLIRLPEVDAPYVEDYEKTEVSEHTQIPKEYSDVRNFLRDQTVDESKDFHGDDLTISRAPKPPSLGFGADRRNADRHAKKLEVLIAGKGKSFRTQTINISLSGVMLEKALPLDMQGGPFEVIFFLQSNGTKKQLVFQGNVTGDLKDRQRLVFGELSTNNQKLLEQLFAA